MKTGDVVRLKGGKALGDVICVKPGRWSNGHVPLVLVRWHPRGPFDGDGYKSRHTETMLEVVR